MKDCKEAIDTVRMLKVERLRKDRFYGCEITHNEDWKRGLDYLREILRKNGHEHVFDGYLGLLKEKK
jgi:hypothetical protein